MKHSCPRARCAPPAQVIAFARFAPLAIALALAACAINPFTEETVTVELPPSIPVIDLVAPGADLRWTVSWLDGSGSRREARDERDSVEITLERGVFTPIIATPETSVFGIPESFLPRAGTIYPDAYDGDAKSLRADWAGGVCAEVAESVMLGARDGFGAGRVIARHFNWRRLARTLDETDEPNKIDRVRLADSILSLDTTKRDVTAGKLAELRPETVAAALAHANAALAHANAALGPANAAFAQDAVFLPEWPARDAVRPASESVSVAGGVTRFFSKAGYLTVIASDGAVRDCYFSRYGLQD